MSFSDYSVSEYNVAEPRPDKPLVVKCTYENSTKRITFSSTRNCSYDLLRQRVSLLARRTLVNNRGVCARIRLPGSSYLCLIEDADHHISPVRSSNVFHCLLRRT